MQLPLSPSAVLSFRLILVLLLFTVTCLVIAFSSFLLAQTTDLIVQNDGARAFLEKIRTVPLETWKIPTLSLSFLGLLGVSTFYRGRFRQNNLIQLGFSFMELALSVAIIAVLDFSYRGVIFIAIVNAMRFFESKRLRVGIAAVCVVVYMLMDYDLVSLRFPVFSINDYLDFYRDSTRAIYYGAKNLLSSFNEILFIIYMVLEIQNWIEENAEIKQLNQRLVKTTEDLQLANVRLEEYAERSEESARIRERDRLAREIHDIVAHSLTGIEIGLKACLDAFRVDPERVRAQLGKILALARSGVEDMRRSVSGMKREADPGGFRDTLAQLVERIQEITGTKIEISLDGEPRGLSPLAEEALYRTAQEGLTNSVRHGEARHVEVELRYNELTVELVVRDDGKGAPDLSEGLGLRSMRERAEALGGQLFWANRSRGFLIQVSLPIPSKGEPLL